MERGEEGRRHCAAGHHDVLTGRGAIVLFPEPERILFGRYAGSIR